MTSPAAPSSTHSSNKLLALAMGAMGVVFGDIGTSPLYTLQVGIAPDSEAQPVMPDVLGLCSLIVWSLMAVVTVKYLYFIMKADNQGEGGILALLALVPQKKHASIGVVAVLVMAGAALLYGDGIITPAISVLSALEGVKLAAPEFKEFVVPLTCIVLLSLFAVQSRGTAGIGRVFGPIMVVWFLCIGALGTWHLIHNPGVLASLSPKWGALFFVHHGWRGIAILGVVVLAVTGGEALYADMGHFGRHPIRVAWIYLVLPALVLCYLGQGALVLKDPSAAANPFFAMVPKGMATYGLVALSAAATIIASQALITGVFSLTHQAVQLGLFPRVTVKHTSRDTEGQIYVPAMNWTLCIACIALVLAFRDSSRLAAAYGIAVSGTMGITSMVYFVVTRRTWGWPLWKSLPLLVLFLSFDLPFFAANLTKFVDGGWIPIVVAAAMMAVMLDWKVGRSVLAERIARGAAPLTEFVDRIETICRTRVPGTGIFFTSNLELTPLVLQMHAQRIRVLPEHVVLLTVNSQHVPHVAPEARTRVEDMGKGVLRVEIATGFMEHPDVPRYLAEAKLPVDLKEATYYVGRETFLAGRGGKMGLLSEGLFGFLSRNATSPTNSFAIPPEQVVELGMQLDL
jgi:KUP system potassium uptake protein